MEDEAQNHCALTTKLRNHKESRKKDIDVSKQHNQMMALGQKF
jgi:hypothetical protein